MREEWREQGEYPKICVVSFSIACAIPIFMYNYFIISMFLCILHRCLLLFVSVIYRLSFLVYSLWTI